MTTDCRHERGKRGEDAAARLLEGKGMRILDRNWRYGHLELDLVCRDGQTIVFVEVRTRAANAMVSPLESLTSSKLQKFLRASRAWLADHNAWEQSCRLDLVCVTDTGSTLNLEHYCDVTLGKSVDSGHTAW